MFPLDPNDPIDKLLAEMQAESAPQPKPPASPSPPPKAGQPGAASLDQLLGQIQGGSQSMGQPESQRSPTLPTPPVPDPLLPLTPPRDPGLDDLLGSLKTTYQQQDAEAERDRQQALAAERQRQQAQEAAERAAFAQQAQDWLSKLDPLSADGLWFNQFAERYPSRIEAAIDFLRAAALNSPEGQP